MSRRPARGPYPATSTGPATEAVSVVILDTVTDSARDDQIEAAIRGLLDNRAADATICPSEAARAVDPDGWRDLMDQVRAAAGRMADRGEIDVTQGGELVSVASVSGPIRLRRKYQAP